MSSFRDFLAGHRRGDRIEEWRPVVFPIRAWGGNNNEDVERDEEFERLLDQSSLGTPTAQAIQALTPPAVYQRLQDHFDNQRQDVHRREVTRVELDADDVVLGVVRSAVDDELPDNLSENCAKVIVRDMTSRTEREMLTRWFQLLAQARHYRVATAQDVVCELLIQGVFRDVRPDIARSIVDIGFAHNGRTSWIVLAACQSSVECSLIADEMIGFSQIFLQRGASAMFGWPGTVSSGVGWAGLSHVGWTRAMIEGRPPLAQLEAAPGSDPRSRRHRCGTDSGSNGGAAGGGHPVHPRGGGGQDPGRRVEIVRGRPGRARHRRDGTVRGARRRERALRAPGGGTRPSRPAAIARRSVLALPDAPRHSPVVFPVGRFSTVRIVGVQFVSGLLLVIFLVVFLVNLTS
jgi:hypothetical protein